MESRVLFLIFTNNVPHFASACITHSSSLISQIVIDLHLILNSAVDLILENVSGVKVVMVSLWTYVILRDSRIFILKKLLEAKFLHESKPQFRKY